MKKVGLADTFVGVTPRSQEIFAHSLAQCLNEEWAASVGTEDVLGSLASLRLVILQLPEDAPNFASLAYGGQM